MNAKKLMVLSYNMVFAVPIQYELIPLRFYIYTNISHTYYRCLCCNPPVKVHYRIAFLKSDMGPILTGWTSKGSLRIGNSQDVCQGAPTKSQ